MVDKFKKQNCQQEEYGFNMNEMRDNIDEIEIRSNLDNNRNDFADLQSHIRDFIDRSYERIMTRQNEIEENHNVNRRLDFS